MNFPEMHRETLEDHWHCWMTAATEPVGVFQVFPRPPMEILFKDRYFESGSGVGSGSGSGIAKWFKDPAQDSIRKI